ncbi:MAG: hypothetical protein MUF81_15330 [Verrucomicrobia bacterium]|nr:hypothetical protein [Verrucomicrobiota bacterium]
MTRTGKIARLAREVREQLNRRLQNGEQGKRLVGWLNSLPEVQAVMAKEFEGRPIREQNISEWRKGGYRDWLDQQEALDMVRRVTAEADELQPDATAPLTDKFVAWLVARYFVAVQKKLAAENGEVDLKQFDKIFNNLVPLRRGDHYADRLRIERERLEHERAQAGKKQEEQFMEWASNPDIREKICQGFTSRAEMLEAVGKQVFGDLWKARPTPPQPEPGDPTGGSPQPPTPSGLIRVNPT